MSATIRTFKTRDEWLENRGNYIGGSDVACILGLNPWKTNVQLWLEKTGKVEPEELGDNPLVVYGINAEPYLRELFKLDYPDMQVFYEENNTWTNDKYPFAAASLDGWLIDSAGRRGIFECKTATINSSTQRAKWDNRIPDNYYCQVLFYMAVCEADFVIVKAQLKTQYGDEEPRLETRHYRIERRDVEKDIELIMKNAERFYRAIQEDKEPNLIISI